MRQFTLKNGVALAALSGVTATALGLTFALSPVSANETPQQSGQQSGQVTVTVEPASFPAAEVLAHVLGKGLTWGRSVPVTFGCKAPTPLISAVNGDSGLYVVPTGFGAQAFQQVLSCASWSYDMDGTTVAVMAVSGGEVRMWNRGDVIASVTTSSSPAVSSMDVRLRSALDGECTDLAPSVEDAKRNPNSADYTPYTVTATVTVDASGVTIPTKEEVGTVADVTPMTMPSGLQGPPEPTAPEKPRELDYPGDEPTSADVKVPAVDTTGPGCGWKFTATSAPVVDETSIRTAADETKAVTLADLKVKQADWVVSAKAFNESYKDWSGERDDWNAYAAEMADVHAQWSSQETLLANYNLAMDSWNAAASARDELVKRQESAQKEYDAAVKKCAEQEPDSDSQSGGLTSGDAQCPAPRPAILDEAPIDPGPQPTKPDLWTPGD